MKLRILLFAVGVLVVLGYAATYPLVDFVVYWTAAHLFVAHHNPYSLLEVFHFQRAVGFDGAMPLPLLCPPWVLPLIAPLGWMHSYLLAWLFSITLLIAAVAVASRLLMDIYFRDIEISEISHPAFYRYLFAFSFYPVLLALKFTQMAPVLLLGMAGFAFFEMRKRAFLAGLCLCVTLLKPQLFLLIWIAVILQRRWNALASAGFISMFLSSIAVFQDHHIFGEYLELMAGSYPRIVLSGIFAGLRSALQPHDTYWLQFLPPLAGLAWLTWYWRKHRPTWNWIERLPVMTLASVVTAPYGYTHDQTLLIIPVIALAAAAARKTGHLPRRLVLLYTVLNATILMAAIYSTPWAVIPAPFVLLCCFLSPVVGWLFGEPAARITVSARPKGDLGPTASGSISSSGSQIPRL